MGAYESHDLAPVRDDERKELNIGRKITYKQYWKVHFRILKLNLFHVHVQAYKMIWNIIFKLVFKERVKPKIC